MKHNKRERGQSLVELAISLVILLWLLSGAVEFGMAFFQFVQLRDAAQEGALYGSTHPTNVTDPGGIIDRIKGSSASPIKLADEITSGTVTVTISAHDSINDIYYPSTDTVNYPVFACEGDGHGIRVQISYNHKIFMPFLAQIISTDEIPLNASVTDTILSPKCP